MIWCYWFYTQIWRLISVFLIVLNKYNTESRFSDALFGLVDAISFFSRFTPDVNLRSPGNRNSQADLQRLQTDGKIRVDFLLLPDYSHLRFRVQKTEQQRLSLQERRKKITEQFVFVWHSSHYQLSVSLHSLPVTHSMEAKVAIIGMSNVNI